MCALDFDHRYLMLLIPRVLLDRLPAVEETIKVRG